jgi:acyl transferase domain-containing protein
VRARLVPVDYASHCAQVEAIKEDLIEALSGIQPGPASIPFYSTVTAELIDTSNLTPEYWFSNLRQTVRFEPTVRTLLADGHHAFIESSPHPILIPGIEETIDTDAVCVPTLHRDEDEAARFLLSLGEAYTVGQRVDWSATLPAASAATDLPTYPFQRRRYWLAAEPQPESVATAVDPAEAEFWSAVERQDATVLADTLDLDQDAVGVVLPALTAWHRRRREQSAVADWRYQVQWSPASESVTAARLDGTWLVVDSVGRSADADDAAAALCAALEQRGANPSRITLDVGTAERAQLLPQLRAAIGDEANLGGIISLIPLDARPHPTCADLAIGVAGTLLLVQALADADLQVPAWHLTAGAAAAAAADEPPVPASAQVWGLGRVAALEHPRLWGGLVDLPSEDAGRYWTRLTALLAAAGDEDQLALRDSGVYVRRLVRAPLSGAAKADGPARQWRPRGTVLVTGGTGALGPHIAQWLADVGAEHLVLVSRSGPEASGTGELAARLADRGVPVTVESCDVSDRAGVAALVDRLDTAGHRVGTVIHAAALMRLDALTELSVEGLGDVVRAKTAGAVHLAELLGAHQPEFVFFSSIAGVWGSSDHGAYAAANAYLDAYAEQLRAAGVPALSVAWGVWGSDRLPDAVNPEQLRRQGLALLAPDRAFTGLRQALDQDETFVALADVDWERFAPVFSLARSRPLLAAIPEARRALAEADSSAVAGPALSSKLLELPDADRDEAILQLVTENVAVVLRHASDSPVPADEAFVRLGFESLTAVELRNRLNQATGLRLPSTLVYDHPTPAAVADHLRTLLIPAEAPTAEPAHTDLRVTDEELMKLIDGEFGEV